MIRKMRLRASKKILGGRLTRLCADVGHVEDSAASCLVWSAISKPPGTMTRRLLVASRNSDVSWWVCERKLRGLRLLE